MNPDITSLPLRDIHLPDAVSWWPLAVGWWMLLGLVAGLVAVTYIYKYLKKRKQFSRLALGEFDSVTAQFHSQGDAHKLLEDLSILLRRISISAYPDKHAAGMTGEAWLQFLDEVVLQSSSKPWPTKFSSPLGQSLITGPYQKQLSLGQQDIQQLLLLCQQWIQTVTRQAKLPSDAGAY